VYKKVRKSRIEKLKSSMKRKTKKPSQNESQILNKESGE